MLIGGYPPPYGGITVHIQRLYEYCKKNGIDCFVLDLPELSDKTYPNPDIISPKDIRRLMQIRKKAMLVHIHVKAFRNAFKIWLLTIFFFSQPKILTVHSGTFTKEFYKSSKMKKLLIGLIFRSSKNIVLVSAAQRAVISKYYEYYLRKVTVIPAFIYPNANSIGISQACQNTILNTSKKKILVSGGYFVYYGYEMVIQYLRRSSEVIGIFALYGKGELEYREKITKLLETMGNVIHFQDLAPETFNWLLQHSDAYVRNIDRDGDSVAIRESAYWGTPIVATNSVERLHGVKLFTFNNVKEFRESLDEVFASRELSAPEKPIDNAPKLLSIYEKI